MRWINPKDRERYILRADRELPPDKQTVFILRPMLCSDYVRFTEEIRAEDGEIGNWARYATAALRYSLVGWEGKDAPPYEADAAGYPTEDTLSRIPIDDRFELGMQADRLNKVTDEQAGKSQ